MSKQQPYIIAPSILAADCARLGEESTNVINAGADWLHIDVMDGHYVPNITFGPIICQSLRNAGITVPFDVHLMIKPIDNMISAYAKAGANMISFHPEATEHVHRSIQLIKDHGCQVGIALNPATPLNYLDHIINDIDMVLIMSVNPGFGGQTFIESSLEKIKQTREIIDKANKPIRLEVDGGVDTQNIQAIAQAGADTFVAGSAIFKSDDYAETIQQMRNQLNPID